VITRPFRFAVTAPSVEGDLACWRDQIRRVEDMGFDTVVMADHFTEGYAIEPMVALTAAASCTSVLRLQTSVLGNDYRHPVLTHRMAAALDVVSEGRFTLGLGAGWMRTDYEAAGLRYDAPGERVSRLQESVAIIKGLFGAEPFTFHGRYYDIEALDGLPKPVQRPHPPLFLGGGSPRVLRFAGKEADLVGVNASLREGALGRHAVVDLEYERVAEKVGWVREGALAAGRNPDEVELEMNHWLVRITDTDADGRAYLERIAGRFEIDPALLDESPSVLVGTVEACIEKLQARRDELGFSCLQLDAGFPPPDMERLAPLVSALAGS
jgi:probable F420-dependent oxidoreductase